jgi:nicotinamide-nucleotide amidase
LELGYCAHNGQVDVRLAARGVRADKLVGDAEAIVRAQLGSAIYGEGDEELETVVIRQLTENKQTLAVAESCTGGGIADRLTNVPGASAVFLGGFVTYSNEAKGKFLGVRSETLAQHGAVSEPVAREMAEGARRVMRSDFAIAVTGIAGPTGGTPEKPVGTVFIAVASPDRTQVIKLFNPWDRLAFKEVTARQAMNCLRRLMTKAG